MPIKIRKATEGDVPFIFNSWLKSYRDNMRNVTNTVYFSEHHKIIETLAKSCNIYVACHTDNPSDIYGYACAERIDGIFITHFVYVKHTYRMIGLGTLLMSQFKPDFKLASVYTHHTKAAEKLAAKYNMIHNPYVATQEEYRKKNANNEGDAE